jgi:hypothetical protein
LSEELVQLAFRNTVPMSVSSVYNDPSQNFTFGSDLEGCV